jgi:hypothetical protein
MKKSQRIYINILYTLISIIFIIFIYGIYKSYIRFENFTTPDKNAIVVLTKGYNTLEQYDSLIKRNESIYSKFYSKANKDMFDIVIFNEGNITTEHQEYIQSRTPELPLKFTSIAFYNNIEVNNMCPPTELSNRFPNGYKNMCYFWSIDFLRYLKEYNYVIRIDEDCIIHKLDSDIIERYTRDNIMFSSANYQESDDIDVTVGMDRFFNTFLSENSLSQKNELKMPYTNFVIINIQYFYHNTIIKKVLEKIKDTNCIFSNRWGDLPIWGYILSYLIDKQYFIEDKNIVYYHGSHAAHIN